MKKLILFILIVFVSNISIAQISISQRLDAAGSDATVDNYNPSGNYSSEIEYCSGQWTINSIPVAWRSFFKFDLSTIPAGSVINSASLSLFYPDSNGFANSPQQPLTHSNASLLQRVVSPWQENLITWNNQPGVSPLNTDTLAESTLPDQDYLNIDVAGLIQNMVDSGNYGFALRLIIEQQYARLFFASGDNPDSSKHPLLEITYTPPTIICFTQKLSPQSEDASVDDYGPANNNPDEIEYFCGGWTIGGVPVRWRNFFKFDFSSIPINSQVQSAYLSLHFPVQNNFFATDTSMSHPNTSIINRVTSPWSESTVNWNNAPSIVSNSQVAIGPTVTSDQDFLNIDVTALVQDMVNDPLNSYGFSLRMIDDSYYARLLIASGDNPDSTKVPMIEVCYSSTINVDELHSDVVEAIFPNPASDQIRVNLKNSNAIDLFKIVDVCGKLIEQRSVKNESSFSVDVSRYSNGIYFLVLNGEKVNFAERIVVAK